MPLRFAYPTPTLVESWVGNMWACRDPGRYSTCKGLVKDILGYVGEAMNMSISVANASDLGRKLPNGNWTGAVKAVLDNEADISLGIWNPAKCEIMACTDPIGEVAFAMLIPMPRRKRFPTAFLEPFSFATWTAVFFAVAATGAFLQSAKHAHFPKFTWFKLLSSLVGQDAVFWRTSDISSIGADDQDGDRSGMRMSMSRPSSSAAAVRGGVMLVFFPMGTWHVTVAVLSMVYSARVIETFLNVYEAKVFTVEALLEKEHAVLVSGVENNVLVDYVKSSGQSTLRRLSHRMQELPSKDYLGFVPKTRQALIDGRTMLSLRTNFVQQGGRRNATWKKFYSVVETETLPVFAWTLYGRKNFPGLEKIRKVVRAGAEAGIFQHLEAIRVSRVHRGRNLDKSAGAQQGHSMEGRTVTLYQILGLFQLLTLGYILAIVAGAAEMIWFRFDRRRPDENNRAASRD